MRFSRRVAKGIDPTAQRLCARCGDDITNLRLEALRCSACVGIYTPLFGMKTCACGVDFRQIKEGQASCSNACAQKAWKSANRKPEPWNDRRKANAIRRRALKSTDDAERFSPLEIFERDGWVCGLCSLPVNKDLPWPHPDSPTLDHVLALARGGNHTRANSQLAHARCNLSKGARPLS